MSGPRVAGYHTRIQHPFLEELLKRHVLGQYETLLDTSGGRGLDEGPAELAERLARRQPVRPYSGAVQIVQGAHPGRLDHSTGERGIG